MSRFRSIAVLAIAAAGASPAAHALLPSIEWNCCQLPAFGEGRPECKVYPRTAERCAQVTKSFAEGDLPGAKAVLTIQAGPRTLWFHAYRGWASLEAPGTDGKTTGGDWRFSPEAADRVVELLNRTPPAR